MVFHSKDRWHGLYTVLYPSNQFHDHIILPSEDFFCVSPCTERKDEYSCAGFDLCLVFFMMLEILAIALIKKAPDGIGLPDVGAAPWSVSFRTFCNCMAVIGKLELSQNLAFQDQNSDNDIDRGIRPRIHLFTIQRGKDVFVDL